MNNKKVSYMKYTGHRQSNSVARERVDYKNYESRRHQLAKKPKVNPVVEAILSIEDLLMETEVNWSISYEPSTKSYSIFIANLSEEEPKPKQDLDEEPVFDMEFIFETEKDCYDLYQYLIDVEKRYGLVTVDDLYEYVGYPPSVTSTDKYGWLKSDINTLYFESLPYGGYLVKITKPKPIV